MSALVKRTVVEAVYDVEGFGKRHWRVGDRAKCRRTGRTGRVKALQSRTVQVQFESLDGQPRRAETFLPHELTALSGPGLKAAAEEARG